MDNIKMMKIKLLVRFAKYIKPYWKKELLLFLLMILTSAGALVSPYILKIFIDDVFPSKDYGLLIKILLIMIGVNVLRLGISFVSEYMFEWVSNHIMKDIRMDLFHHLVHLPMSYYDKNKTGDIIHRVNSEVNSIQGILTGTAIRLINDACTIIGLTTALCLLNYKLFLISIVVMPFIFLNTRHFQPKIHKYIKKGREKDSAILSFLIEKFENVKLIKSYNRYDYEKSRLNHQIQEQIGINIGTVKLSATTRNISSLMVTAVPVLIFAVGGKQVMSGSMTIGALVAFIQYMNRFFDPFKDLMGLYWDTIRAGVSMQRIFELFEVPVQKNEGKVLTYVSLVHKTLFFDNIGFSYDGLMVVDQLTLRLEAGKKYAFVGSSGCGKSTLVNLLCNFYQPQQGHIYIGDVDIRNMDINELRSKIAVVTQDNQLFHDSVWENIKYGNPESSDPDIAKASELTGLDEQVKKIKNNYQAIVGDRGTKLSGGQKQRIAITRAILKNADIIILDEATSALDSESEKTIFENLCGLYRDKTMILISHRLSAIKDVDEIICMDKGQVIEKGSHEELITKRGFYRNLFKEQIE